jgi:tetratricopeptide (TPR) repeat protein
MDSALALDPSLRRAYLYRALARETVGDYPGAIADLRRRLALDPGQAEAVGELARIYQGVGELPLAQQLYGQLEEKTPGAPIAVLGRAMIAYQSERKQAAAASLLRGFLEREKLGRSERVDAWVHLAAAQRLSGELELAAQAANQALKLSDRNSGAHFQLFLIALERHSPDEAERHLALLEPTLDDPGLAKLLRGKLLLAQGRALDAIRHFAESAQSDPRRVDALLLAGVAGAIAGKRDESLRYLVLAGQRDPRQIAPCSLGGRLFLGPEDALSGAEDKVIRMANGPLDVTPRLYEGLIRYHRRNLVGADKVLRQVLDVDLRNALAHSLRALIAIDRSALGVARAEAERAVASGRSLALAHYALGLVLARTGALGNAQRELREAETLSPNVLATQVALAELEAKAKDKPAARARLIHVLRADPSHLEAKRALYALQR